MLSVKELIKSSYLPSLPSKYVQETSTPDCMIQDAEETIPIIDYSLFISGTPDQRSKVIEDIGHACRDWGFFMVVNHGVPEKLREDMLKASQGFFGMPEEEKREYMVQDVFAPIKCGTSFNGPADKTFFWRDYLRAYVHPQFNAPNKPPGFSKIVQEYTKRAQELVIELLRGVSVSLGLEENYINNKLDVELGSQVLAINYYPPCPQPETSMGLPLHTDHGLLTLVIQNDIDGLEILHKGKWVLVNPPPNSFLVNTGDHMEIFTNGKYKSLEHRATVNNKSTRISIVTAHGPPLDTIVCPAPEFVCSGNNPPAGYRRTKYREYLELQQTNQLGVQKRFLDHVRL